MKREERGSDLDVAIMEALKGFQAGLWTALPCEVTKVELNGSKRTVDCQPTIQARITQPDGTYQWVTMPILLDCPIVFPEGGNFSLTFPIAIGDEVLVVLSSRCIDAWWQQGGIQPQADLRMHDLSDGFAIAGVRSQPRAIPNISTTNVQLRSLDGETFIELTPAGACNITAPNSITMQSEGPILIETPSTFTVNAAGGIYLNGVWIDAEGNLRAPKDIWDNFETNTLSSAQMRSIYNTHDHLVTGVGTNTNDPNQPMT